MVKLSVDAKRVLVLSWSSCALLSVVRALACRWAGVTVLTRSHDPVVARSRYIRRWEVFGREDSVDSILGRLEALVKRDGIDLVMANDEGSVEFISANRDRLAPFVLTTPVAELDVVRRLRDKRRFMDLVEELGIPHPKSLLSGAGDDGSIGERALAELRGPWVVKPANLTCGFGVERCDTPEQLLAALASKHETGGPFLIQEFLAGQDLDFCLVARQGRILRWTSRIGMGPKDRFGAPGSLWELRRVPELLPCMERLVESTAWSGALDVDCVYETNTGSWGALECNTRFGATTLADATAGVNLPEALVLAGLDRPVPEVECRAQAFYCGGWGLPEFLGLGGRPRRKIRETYLPYVLRDPFPELSVVVCSRMMKAVERVKSARGGRPEVMESNLHH